MVRNKKVCQNFTVDTKMDIQFRGNINTQRRLTDGVLFNVIHITLDSQC